MQTEIRIFGRDDGSGKVGVNLGQIDPLMVNATQAARFRQHVGRRWWIHEGKQDHCKQDKDRQAKRAPSQPAKDPFVHGQS